MDIHTNSSRKRIKTQNSVNRKSNWVCDEFRWCSVKRIEQLTDEEDYPTRILSNGEHERMVRHESQPRLLTDHRTFYNNFLFSSLSYIINCALKLV